MFEYIMYGTVFELED